MNVNLSRRAAIAEGRSTYQGKPCKNCGSTEKSVRGHACVVCRRNQQQLNNQKYWQRIKESGKSVEYSQSTSHHRKKYYDTHKEALKETLHQKKSALDVFYIKKALTNIKSKCKTKGIVFNLVPEDIVIPELCPVLGIPLEFNGGNLSRDSSPSIDRIDPSRGYEVDNIVIVSNRVNRIKNNSSLQEMENILNFYKEFK